MDNKHQQPPQVGPDRLETNYGEGNDNTKQGSKSKKKGEDFEGFKPNAATVAVQQPKEKPPYFVN